MKPRRFVPRTLVFLFATFLWLPTPLYALRDKAVVEKDADTVSGLEEALRKPKAALARLAGFVIPPPLTTPSQIRPPAEKLPGGGAPPGGSGFNAPGLGLGQQTQQALPFLVELTAVEPPQAAYNPLDEKLYIVQPDEERILAYEASTGRPTGFEIETPGRPLVVASEPGTGRLLILSEGKEGSRLQAFEPKTNQWIPPAVPIPGSPGGIAIEPETRFPFVLTLDNPPLPVPLKVEGPQPPAAQQPVGRVQLFNLATGLPVGLTFGNLTNPSAVGYDPSRQRLLIAEETAGRVIGLDARTGRPVFEIKGLNRPNSVALSSDGQRIFVTERSAGRLVAFEARTGRPIGLTIEGLQSPRIEAANPAAQTLFVSETILQGPLFVWRLRAVSEVDGRLIQGVPAPAAVLPISAPTVPSSPASARPAGLEEGIPPALLKQVAKRILSKQVELTVAGPFRFLTVAEIYPRILEAIAPSGPERSRIEQIFQDNRFTEAGLAEWIGLPLQGSAKGYWERAALLLEAAPAVIDALVRAAKEKEGAPLQSYDISLITAAEITLRIPLAVDVRRGTMQLVGVSGQEARKFVIRTARLLKIPIAGAGLEEPAAILPGAGGVSGPAAAPARAPMAARREVIPGPILEHLRTLESADHQVLNRQISGLVRALDRRGIEPRPLFEETLLAALKKFPPDQIRPALKLAAELLREGISPEAVLLGLPAVSEASGGKTAEFRSLLPVLGQLLTRLKESAGEDESVTIPAKEVASLTLEAIRLTQQGLDYALEVGGQSVQVVNPAFAGQPAAPAPAVRLVPRLPGPGAVLPPTAGGIQIGPDRAAVIVLRAQPPVSLEELAQELAARIPSTGTALEPIRFIVDTNHVRPGQGDTRVLHLAQLAVWMKQKDPNALIEVAGVATAAELELAEAQLSDSVSRDLLAGRILTYEPLNEASHRQALDLLVQAFPLFKDLPPQQVIRRIDTSTLRGFLDALYHLGIRDLSQELWDKIEATLTSI